MHVSGLRRRPVGDLLEEDAKLALLANGGLAELVALGVREPAPVVHAVAAVKRVHAEAREVVVTLLQLLGEVVLVLLELALWVDVPAPRPELALDAVDVVVAVAEELVHDERVLGDALVVLVLGASAGRRDEVRVLGDHRGRVTQPRREHGGHLRLNLHHLVRELLLELRLRERRLSLRQRQLVLLLNCRHLCDVLLLEDLEGGHSGSHDDR